LKNKRLRHTEFHHKLQPEQLRQLIVAVETKFEELRHSDNGDKAQHCRENLDDAEDCVAFCVLFYSSHSVPETTEAAMGVMSLTGMI
jgi:hypothetical protein